MAFTDYEVADTPYDQPEDSTPSAADIQADRRYPKYMLVYDKANDTWRNALIMIKFCQEYHYVNDYGHSVPVSCNGQATLRATTHQGYPLNGGPVDAYTGNESWLACTWCVDEARTEGLAHGFAQESTYIRLDNGQPY